MDSDHENYHSESEFYYPEDEDLISEKENVQRSGNNSVQDEIQNEIQDFIEQQRPENTVKKTTYDINVWNRFCATVNEQRKLEDIPATELNVLMCRFFMTITKKDGSVYEPVSLTSFHRSLQRYLNNTNSSLNIFKDQEFAKSREVLVARKRQLVEKFAKGNRPQAARALTEAEEDMLFEKGLFGDHEPEALQRTVWWALSLHFGFRARDESRKLKWEDIVLDVDPETGNEVVVWRAERGSKTRHGDGHQRAFFPTAQATNNHRCPVNLYKAFASHRPEAANLPESPFFLAVNHKRRPGSQIWYSKGALGKNSIGKFLVNAAKAAGLPGNISNHSVRKTCISRLMDAEVPCNYVAQLSGHKNLKSLDAYKAASVVHQRSCPLSRFTSTIASKHHSISQQRPQSSQPTNTTSVNAQASATTTTTGLFSGAKIGKFEGCTFNFNFASTSSGDTSSENQPTKRRHLSILEDSDSD